MVVADECRLQEEPNPFYRWHVKGQTPVVKLLLSKDKMGFWGALSRRSKRLVATHMSQMQNSQEACIFLEQIKKRYQGQGKVLLVWDGASYHRSQEIKDWLQNNPGVVELMRFPTYSPDLNPQEKVWKALRKDLSTVVQQYTFKQVIDRACRFLLTARFDFKFT